MIILERKTYQKWVCLDIINTLWLLIVQELRKVNIAYVINKKLKEEMISVSNLEKQFIN